jgi:hypothetical protein
MLGSRRVLELEGIASQVIQLVRAAGVLGIEVAVGAYRADVVGLIVKPVEIEAAAWPLIDPVAHPKSREKYFTVAPVLH